MEVNRSFPVLGFTVHAGESPAWFEIAVATDPALFEPAAKAQRTATNFYSTRAEGPLPIQGSEAVYLIPPGVLANFAGNENLYYALATFPHPDGQNPTIVRIPTGATTPIHISRSFTGVVRRLPAGGARNGPGRATYANGNRQAAEWAGDTAAPGKTEPIGTNGASQPAPAPETPTVAAASAFDVEYKDGFEPTHGEIPPETVADPDASYGIEGPIPDEAAPALAQALAAAPEYPGASRFVAAHPTNFRARTTPRTIERIVIHITDGGSNINGTIGWFASQHQPPAGPSSAHYIVGQDGEVVQMVRHDDVAYHARAANGNSIGIEHVANSRGLRPTQAEYEASAQLVSWLADLYGIPCDRDHIVGHNEADVGTSHSGCPTVAWDWGQYMSTLEAARSAAQPAAEYAPQELATSLGNVDVSYDVPLVPQTDKLSCWAGAMAMLVGFRHQISIAPETLAEQVGRSLRMSYGWDELEAVRDGFGFQTIELPSDASLYYTPTQWHDWLARYGPLWVTTVGNPSHAIVVRGIHGDLTPDGTTISILNPWDTTTAFDSDVVDFHPPNQGRAYDQKFSDFASDFGSVGLALPFGDWRVLYLPPVDASAQALAAVDAHVDDVELVPQLTGMSCWAASAAMVVGWRDRVSIDPSAIASGSGHWSAYTAGLNPSDRADLARSWGLVTGAAQDYTVEGFAGLIEAYGPLWVGVAVPSGHAVCVTGVSGDGTADGTTVRYHDPWPPGTGAADQTKSYRQFMTEYDSRMTTDPSGNVNVQVLHADKRADAGAQSLGFSGHAGALGLVPVSAEAVERMRAELIAHAAPGAGHLNCIEIMNAGLRAFYGSELDNTDGTRKPLGSSVQATMAALESYGLAQSPQVFDFVDAAGRVTTGTRRPDRLAPSVEGSIMARAEAEAMSGWYVFGLSVMDGYHSVTLAVQFNGTGDSLTKVYWADQIYGGWDDVTGTLDDRLTQRTQSWWDPLPANRKAKTSARVWALNP
jgi:N-acetyl-anhydromuramyl-L-alanine amidase AmpD